MTVELRNDENKRVGGFSIDSYNSVVAYNDFNNQTFESTGNMTDITSSSTNGGEGMDLRRYKRGLGSSSVGNIGIYADGAKNSFDLVFDYKAKTLQGTITSQTGTCVGKPMPMLGVDETTTENNKVTKFVITSNYASANATAPARRCWFDNLLIYKYASNAEGVSDVYEVATEIQNVNVTANVPVAIYNVAGAKVKGMAKGINIVKYADGSVQKVLVK